MDNQRRRLEETVHSGAFSRAVEACGSSSNSHSRAVSGGVTIGSAHGNHGPKRMNGTLNPHKPALRLGPGPLSGEANTNQAFARPVSNSSSRIEQLPTLHWTFYRDRQRARNVARQRQQQQQHQQQQQQHQLNAVRQQQFNGTQFDFQYQVPGTDSTFSMLQQQQMHQQYMLQLQAANNSLVLQQYGNRNALPTMLGNQQFMPNNFRSNRR